MAVALVALSLSACDRYQVGRGFAVPSCAMAPTVNAGGRVVARKAEPGELRRGNMVVFRRPVPPDGTAVGRVVAVGGDVVEFKGGAFLLNGSPAYEPYLTADAPRAGQDLPAATVRPDHFFILGDNRLGSADSRSFGQVPSADIKGEAGILDKGDPEACP